MLKIAIKFQTATKKPRPCHANLIRVSSKMTQFLKENTLSPKDDIQPLRETELSSEDDIVFERKYIKFKR